MSFTQSSFGPISSHGNSDMPNIWTYRTNDTLLETMQSDYFKLKLPVINNGDFINIDSLNGKYSGVFAKVGADLTIDIISPEFSNRVVVRQASDLSGDLLATKEYVIDGVIDMTGSGMSIHVPAGGLTIKGLGANISKLICSDDNYSLFVSAVGGSGDLIQSNMDISVTGELSKVYDLKSDDGLSLFSAEDLIWDDCTSLGVIDNFLQGLESVTTRRGGTPELELSGEWLGGYLIETSNALFLADGAYTIFKAGVDFTMLSRFRCNANINLPTSVSLSDFEPVNFPNPSTFQLDGMILTRDGASDASDPNITPNLSSADLASDWADNIGVRNTFVGGEIDVTSEVTTTINASGVFVDLLGGYTATDLQHFDSPSSGQLRHLGTSPLEYKVQGQYVIEGTANNVAELKVVVFRSETSSFEDQKTIERVINNLAGSRDIAYFTISNNITLNKNDYVKLQIANSFSTDNMTAEINSFMTVEAR